MTTDFDGRPGWQAANHRLLDRDRTSQVRAPFNRAVLDQHAILHAGSGHGGPGAETSCRGGTVATGTSCFGPE